MFKSYSNQMRKNEKTQSPGYEANSREYQYMNVQEWYKWRYPLIQWTIMNNISHDKSISITKHEENAVRKVRKKTD